MQIHADTYRYMQIHAYTYIYTQTRIHVPHVTSPWLGPLTWDHFRSSLGPLTCDTRQSLHWGNWHGILLDCALQAGRVAAGRQRSIFGENSKSSAPRYDSQLTLLSKQNLPGFLLIPIFHRLFSTDQLSWFYLQSSSSCRILPRFRKLHHVIFQVLYCLTWSIKYFDIVNLNFKCRIIL